jgi:hypothetical protein
MSFDDMAYNRALTPKLSSKAVLTKSRILLLVLLILIIQIAVFNVFIIDPHVAFNKQGSTAQQQQWWNEDRSSSKISTTMKTRSQVVDYDYDEIYNSFGTHYPILIIVTTL